MRVPWDGLRIIPELLLKNDPVVKFTPEVYLKPVFLDVARMFLR